MTDGASQTLDTRQVEHLYVHVPFCIRKCAYCAFYSEPDAHSKSSLDRFVRRALEGLELRLGADGPSLKTVYLGGGTPSLLPPDLIHKLLDGVRNRRPLAPGAEVTLEANPGTVQLGALPDYEQAGINRVSIGLQSMDDRVLEWLGRPHTFRDGLTLLSEAVSLGLRTSVDLIYGIPGQSVLDWEEELNRVSGLGVPHFSCYSLTVEENTPLERAINSGALPAPHPAYEDSFFRTTHQTLARMGFPGYEVSSFARTQWDRSQHNQAYWQAKPYLGIGPGAHSFDGKHRVWNKPDLEAWLADEGRLPPHSGETLTDEQRLLEVLMLGLRTTDGAAIESVRSLCSESQFESLAVRIAELDTEGLVEVTLTHWRPTLDGLTVADGLPLRLVVNSNVSS